MRHPILLAFLGAMALSGCASQSEELLPVRNALDSGDPAGAVELLNRQMGVTSGAGLPKEMRGNTALLVLDRASVQQALDRPLASARDYEAADKALDMLDLAHNAGDSIGEYVFSGSSGKYVAPPYEKLLINTMNLVNYLERGDLDGARVEARRLSVMQRYLRDDLHEGDNTVLGLGAVLAGFAFEKSGNADEALRYDDEALRFGPIDSLAGPVSELLARGHFSSPRLREAAATFRGPPGPVDGDGDVLVVIGYGRVPPKIAQRAPIGLALTWMSGALSPYDADRANRLAAQGLVTWINYPTLGRAQGSYGLPLCQIDGQLVAPDESVDIAAEVRKEWRKVEGRIVLSAITRVISRYAAGTAVHQVAGKNSLVGELLDLGTQATLSALDTPDTRSWETLPARVAVVRVRLPAGHHRVVVGARGGWRTVDVDLKPGGFAVVPLLALR